MSSRAAALAFQRRGDLRFSGKKHQIELFQSKRGLLCRGEHPPRNDMVWMLPNCQVARIFSVKNEKTKFFWKTKELSNHYLTNKN
jgi:hypothetical protein